MGFFSRAGRPCFPRPTKTSRVFLEVESLESRVVPYATSGNAWPNPELVTISFVPDGTIVGTSNSGYVYSNLFAKMNARFGSPAVWQREILRAAQTWSPQTNVNFVAVTDNGTPIGQGSYQQGDPGMGDIRISGYAYSTSYLATAYMPPPANNYSIAGDIQFNTQVSWNINATYDLGTVAAHEFGHALGLNHSSVASAEMYSSYGGKKALTSDDVAGIRAIQGDRVADSYDAAAANGSIATARDISSTISAATLTALVPDLDITTNSDVDHYTFRAPSGSGSTLTVAVQSSGLSLLTPAVTIYGADGATVLASATSAGQNGTGTLLLTVNGVTAGQQFYVKVAGADSSVFSTGTYALTLNFGSGTAPAEPQANTRMANGATMQAGGGQAQTSSGGGLLGGLTGGLLSTASYAVKLLSAQTGLSLEMALGILNGTASADSNSQEAEQAFDRNITGCRCSSCMRALAEKAGTPDWQAPAGDNLGFSFTVDSSTTNGNTRHTTQMTWITEPTEAETLCHRVISAYFSSDEPGLEGAGEIWQVNADSDAETALDQVAAELALGDSFVCGID